MYSQSLVRVTAMSGLPLVKILIWNLDLRLVPNLHSLIATSSVDLVGLIDIRPSREQTLYMRWVGGEILSLFTWHYSVLCPIANSSWKLWIQVPILRASYPENLLES